jgi:NTP pyrophosphatase (non-canonical NTP hydrolase)
MEFNQATNQTYKLAYLNLKREFEDSTKKANETILALAIEKTELAQANKKYQEIVDKLAEEIVKLTSIVKSLENAGEENIVLHEKVHLLEEELCQVALEHSNTLVENQQVKQTLKSLRNSVIKHITE